jgi:galactokinase
LLLDCRDLSNRQVAVPDDVQVVICDTRAKRELTRSPYAERRASCESGARTLGVESLRDLTSAELGRRASELSSDVAKRCRFIVEEDERVLALERALPAGDRAAIRSAALASFAGARDLYEIACPEMEAMHATMLAAPGVIGARQAGAGFGGCMVAFVELAQVPEFAASVRANYLASTGLAPEVYPVRATVGAGVIR